MPKATRAMYPTQKQELQQNNFGGYMHTPDCCDGQIYDMEAISSFSQPFLRPLSRRGAYLSAPGAVMVFHHNDWGYVTDSGVLTYGRRVIGTVPPDSKPVVVGNRIVFWKNGESKIMNVAYDIKGEYSTLAALQSGGTKVEGYAYAVGTTTPKTIYVYRQTTNTWEQGEVELQDMRISFTLTGVRFLGTTYQGVKADANTIRATSATAWTNSGLKVGDAIEITGCTTHPENNKIAIIREINGADLIFYEHTFKLNGSAGTTAYTEPGTLRFTKEQPELDVIFALNNRLWGAKDDTIWCSKLGDPTNFYVYDGLSSDGWFNATGTAEKFTAGCAYLGYPTFFKEHNIFKIFGSNAENFQFSMSATEGVKKGCQDSLAIAGETLYYWSNNGLTAYQGGLPQFVGQPFGQAKYEKVKAISDGRRIYLSMTEEYKDDFWCWCIDTESGNIYKETRMTVMQMIRAGEDLYALGKEQGNSTVSPYKLNGNYENAMPAMIEWGRFYAATLDKKSLQKLSIRMRAKPDAEIRIYISYDDGRWELVRKLYTKSWNVTDVPILLRRCDNFRLKLVTKGYWEIQQINRAVISGTTTRR